MKKLALLAVLVFGLGLFSSCKKDYVCECKYDSDLIDDQSVTFENVSKSDAEDACDELDAIAGVSCNLK